MGRHKKVEEVKDDRQIVIVQKLIIGTMDLGVIGNTPLLGSNMDMISVENIERKKKGQMVIKDTRTDEQKLKDSVHYTPEGLVGLPSAAFMKGMIECAPYLDGLDKKRVMGSVRILQDIIPIRYKKQTVHETWGLNAGMSKAPKLIRRMMFHDWECNIKISYNASNITPEQIANLLNWAGFQMGVGGWRPQKGGIFGQYKVK